MIAHADHRAIVRALAALNDARSHVSNASGAIRAATDSPLSEAPAALDAAQTELLAAWEALAYIAAELGES